jgi:hypothetical protein
MDRLKTGAYYCKCLPICLLPANIYAPLDIEIFLMEELSKCQKLIEKFSEGEDVDIVVKESGKKDNQLNNKRKAITTLVDNVQPFTVQF